MTKTLPKFKRRRRRKPVVKDVRCTVRLIVGGRTAKTVRRRITMSQALRELAGDPVSNEGRLLTGVPLNVSRRVVKGVRVVLMYVADHRVTPEPMRETFALTDAVAVIRAGVPL